MIHVPPTLKRTIEVLNNFVNPRFKSFSTIEDLQRDLLIVVLADIYQRDPKNIAEKLIEFRLRVGCGE